MRVSRAGAIAALLGAVVLLAGASSRAGAQRPDSAQRDTTRQARDSARAADERPFVRGGIYDKPHQTRLLGRTAIGGYAEAHARY